MRRKWTPVLTAALLLLAFWGWRTWDGHFTPERWAETDEAHRGKLVDSLLDQYDRLVGLSQGEVEALLGPDTPGGQREEALTPEGSTVRPLLVYRAGGPPLGHVPGVPVRLSGGRPGDRGPAGGGLSACTER